MVCGQLTLLWGYWMPALKRYGSLLHLAHVLPGKPTICGVTIRNHSQFINALLWTDRNHSLCRDLPDVLAK